MDPTLRTWAPVVVVLALLPAAFVGLRACLPSIGSAEAEAETSSASCAACHAGVTSAWARSTHARAEWGFESDATWPEGWREATQPLGDPVGAIGVDPLFQLLVPAAGGRLQATGRAYDPAREEWFDVFGDPRAPGDWGHWTGGAMTWNSQCASCHATAVTKGYDAATDHYDTDLLEHGVGCVACHGTEHARTLAAEQITDTCLACHSLRAELTGAFRPGDAYLDHFAPTWVDLTDQFHPDGQIRAESFEGTAFAGSRMHAAGVGCTTCHDPHSGTLVRPGDSLCEACHQALPDFAPHDPHPDGTVGCVGCHMPVTTYMQRDPRHDHGFPIPDPGAPEALGPDVCTRCHEDRDRSWTASVAAAWWPDRTPDRALATAVLAARRGEPGTSGFLDRDTSDQPVGRRVSAILASDASHPAVRADLRSLLSAKHTELRLAAVQALASQVAHPEVASALVTSLDDPLRAVRVEAARAVRHLLRPDDPRLRDYVGYLTANADQPAALHESGTWLFEAGDPTSAVAVLERAIALDPRSAVLRDSGAVALAALGHHDRAAAHLREAADLVPTDASLWMRLGLAEAAVGDLSAATAALTHATDLEPDHARAWYNLGLAQVGLGRVATGLECLRKATVAAPDDAELAYGLAATLWDQGEHQAARKAATAVLEIDPDHTGAQRLLREP